MTYLRAITDGGRAGFVPVPQARGRLCWLAVSDLRIDDRYQRPLGETNWRAINRIAGDFRWSRFAPLLVADIGGGLYAVIDGQHRVHAAHLCGLDEVPCIVVEADPAAQADAFGAVNGAVVRMSAINIFRAALAAGEGWAERCEAVVADGGCRLMTSNNSTNRKKPGEVYCVGLIRDLVTRGHAPAVRAGLAAIRAHDVRGRVALYADVMLAPWLRGVAMAAGFDRADLADVLRRNPPYLVIERADRARAAGAARGGATEVRRHAFTALVEGAVA